MNVVESVANLERESMELPRTPKQLVQQPTCSWASHTNLSLVTATQWLPRGHVSRHPVGLSPRIDKGHGLRRTQNVPNGVPMGLKRRSTCHGAHGVGPVASQSHAFCHLVEENP
jgi:hypothetical protein